MDNKRNTEGIDSKIKKATEEIINSYKKTKEVFTWKRKTADKLFLAVHGNTQNGQIARDDWKPFLKENT